MELAINLNQSAYRTGDVVTGTVLLFTEEDTRVKDLIVNIYGYARVSWDEKATKTYRAGLARRAVVSKSDTYLDHSILLLHHDQMPGQFSSVTLQGHHTSPKPVRSGCAPFLPNIATGLEKGLLIPAGRHSFSFKFVIPKRLPCTYEGTLGYIRYGAKAILGRPWRMDLEDNKTFHLHGKMDLNEEFGPEIKLPIGASESFDVLGVMCLRKGAINVDLRLPRRGYTLGEHIPFQVDIENRSAKNLEVEVSLIQEVIFNAYSTSDAKSIINIVDFDNKMGGIAPFATSNWRDGSLIIPNVHVSTPKLQRAIQVKYYVKLTVVYSIWKQPYKLPVDIFIGHSGAQ